MLILCVGYSGIMEVILKLGSVFAELFAQGEKHKKSTF